MMAMWASLVNPVCLAYCADDPANKCRVRSVLTLKVLQDREQRRARVWHEPSEALDHKPRAELNQWLTLYCRSNSNMR